MTDRTVLDFNPSILSDALHTLSSLMISDRVSLGTEYTPDIRGIETVRINVTACPAERDELVAALGNPIHSDWMTTDGGWCRDWRGVLLTMPMIVFENLPGPSAAVEAEPPTRDPVGDVVPSPSPVPSCPGAPANFEADCGEAGPHGPHPLGDEPPPIVDELPECGAWCADGPGGLCVKDLGHPDDHGDAEPAYLPPAGEVVVATIDGPIVTGPYDGPAVIVRAATLDDREWAGRAGLEQADGKHWADPETAEVARRYAVNRARHAFAGQTFTTPTAALAALDAWAGRSMLTDGDVSALAGELLAIPAAPVLAVARPFVRWPGRRRPPGRHSAGQRPEHITAAGPVA